MAARLIYGRGRFERVSDLIRDRMHWLRVPQRISFKCALLAYKGQHGLAPHYIKNYCQPTLSLQCRNALRSLTEVNLIIPRTKTSLTNVRLRLLVLKAGIPYLTMSKLSVQLALSSLDLRHFCLGSRIAITTAKVPLSSKHFVLL